MNVFVALPNETDLYWPKIKDGMIASCRETGNEVTAGWLWQECRAGQAFLIIAGDDDVLGAAVVKFHDNGKVLKGLALCGSRIEEWWPMLCEKVREIMRDGDATRFIDYARPGMKFRYPNARKIGVIFEVMP